MMKLPENELFYCKHILEVSDLENKLDAFSIGRESGIGLERYLKELATKEEMTGETRTYLILDKETEEIVAYFSLKAGMISINERLPIVDEYFLHRRMKPRYDMGCIFMSQKI